MTGESRLDAAALYRLMAWLSPSYPIGAFSYSSGIEWAVEAGDIRDAATLQDWLAVMLGEGSGFCDAVFFAHAHRAAAASDGAALRRGRGTRRAPLRRRRSAISKRPRRAAPSSTPRARPGHALRSIASRRCRRSVAAGRGRRGLRRSRDPARACARRLSARAGRGTDLGRRAARAARPDRRPARSGRARTGAWQRPSARALVTPLGELGSAAFRADIASMRHETQYTRLFRS